MIFWSAYIKGWEMMIRAGLAAPGKFQQQGFQITSVAGTLGAALVAAELLRLDDAQRMNALGIALSQSSGVFEFLTNGSTVKSLHAGWAAHGGIVAAALAGAGLTGPATAFEGQFGLFRRFAADPDAADRFAEFDRNARHRMASAAGGVQVLSMLPLHPSFHRSLGDRTRTKPRPHHRNDRMRGSARRRSADLRSLGA